MNETDILIIGAGMTGLTAAGDLQRAGHRVLVVDKGRGVGGRMATRRIGQAVLDHGAQFFTAKAPRFAAAVEGWQKADVAKAWFAGDQAADHIRWRGAPNMAAVAKHLARGLDVRLNTRITSISRTEHGWSAAAESGAVFYAKAILLTAPVEQSLALPDVAALDLHPKIVTGLQEIRYERCLAVMAVLATPSAVPAPGALTLADGPIVWIADNRQKGISPVPAVTIHAAADFSLAHWEEDRRQVGRALLEAAQPHIGAPATEFQVHGWRYSRPLRIHEAPYVALSSSPPLLLAGDAFAGARVEGAAGSGWAAAEALNRLLSTIAD